MTKQDFVILEKVFCSEAETALRHGSLPWQSKSKAAAKLADKGYLEKVTVMLGGRFPVRIEGYMLTHAGRMAYCETCEEVA